MVVLSVVAFGSVLFSPIHSNAAPTALRSVPIYNRPFAWGCTPKLHRDSAGVVTVVGCPTVTRSPGACTWTSDDDDQFLTCECVGGGSVLCKGTVFSLDSEVMGWMCEREACPGACTETPEPAAAGDFFACDC